MADNLTLNAGSGGSDLATDEISSVHYQRVKVSHGADGSATDTSHTAPLPIEGGDAENAAVSMNPVVVGGRYDSSSRTLGDGDAGAIALDADGAVHISDGGDTITVDGTVDLGATDNAVLDSIDSSTSTLSTVVQNEDAAHGSGNAGIMSLAVRNDTLAALGGTDGDYAPLQVNADGALYVIDEGVQAALSGSELQVDIVASLPAGTNAIGKLAANDGVDIGDVDVTSVTPGTGATDLGKAIDTAAGSTDTGVASLAVRDDSLTTLTPVDGDYVPLRVNSTGALHVTGGGGGTEYTDDTSTHSSGSTAGGAIFAAATPTDGSVDANDLGVVAMSTDRRLHTDAQIVGQDANLTVDLGTTDNAVLDNIDTQTSAIQTAVELIDDAISGTEMQVDVVAALPAGTNAIGKLAANDGVDIGDVDVTSVVPGTGATSLGKAEDAVHSTGDTGVMALAVRNDTLAALAGTDGDYAPLQVDASGGLYVESADLGTIAGAVSGSEMQVDVVGSLPAGTNAIGTLAANDGVDIGDVDVTSISAGTNLIGDVGISGARTSGGTTFFHSDDLDESEEQVKGSAGQIYWITAYNVSASLLYLQVFNNTAASVTVGTTAPDMVFPIPTQGDTNGAGFVLSVPNGIAMGTGITLAATTTATGSTGPGANECLVNVGYA